MIDVQSYTDYYPFGSLMPQRYQASENYRYGFNGKEMDNKIKGSTGTQYDYGFRIYDPRIGKFLSVDPLAKNYPFYTPYQFAGNAPIWAIDLDGLEQAVIVRWYDNQNNYTGVTVFRIENVNDRPFGANNFLFLNLSDNPTNNTAIRALGNATSMIGNRNSNSSDFTTFILDNQQGSTTSSLTDFTGNAEVLTNPTGNLIFGTGFIRPNISAANRTDLANADITIANRTRRSPNLAGNIGATQWRGNSTNTIYFGFASSQYNGNIQDPNPGSNRTNDQSIGFVTAKLLRNPDRIATITGNASSPDGLGTINVPLATRRANTTFNLLVGRTPALLGQIINNGGQGATNAGTNPNNNVPGQINNTQNATITFTIPRQNQ